MQKNKTKIAIIILFIVSILLLVSFTISIIVKHLINTSNNEVNKNLIMINNVLQEVTVDSEDDVELEKVVENSKDDVKSQEETESDSVLEDANNIIGTLEISKINLTAPIKEGISQEILAEYIGHFPNSGIWDGNVVLASHNRGSLVEHYFERIHELTKGDAIIYKTKLGKRSYQVTEIKKIASTDWTVTEENKKNIITLLTCITGHPESRLCVIAEEKNN